MESSPKFSMLARTGSSVPCRPLPVSSNATLSSSAPTGAIAAIIAGPAGTGHAPSPDIRSEARRNARHARGGYEDGNLSCRRRIALHMEAIREKYVEDTTHHGMHTATSSVYCERTNLRNPLIPCGFYRCPVKANRLKVDIGATDRKSKRLNSSH